MNEEMKRQENKITVEQAIKEVIEENDVFSEGMREIPMPDVKKLAESVCDEKPTGAVVRENCARQFKRPVIKAAGLAFVVLVGAAFVTANLNENSVLAGKLGLKDRTVEALHNDVEGSSQKNKASVEVLDWNELSSVSAKFIPDAVLPAAVPEDLVFEKAELSKQSDDKWEMRFFFKDQQGQKISVYEAVSDFGILHEQKNLKDQLQPAEQDFYKLTAEGRDQGVVYMGDACYWIIYGTQDLDVCADIVQQF